MKRILLLRLDRIGDFVLFSSVLPQLREYFKGNSLTLLVNSLVAPLAEECPFVDDVISVDPFRYETEYEYQNGMAGRLRDRFDVAINTMYTRSPASDNLIARTRAPIKIGFSCLDKDGREERRSREGGLYTHLIHARTEWKFEIDRHHDLLKGLGIKADRKDLVPRLWIPEKEGKKASAFLEITLGVGRPFLMLCPGGGARIREWSPSGFAHISDHLSEKYGYSILIAGSVGDRPLAGLIMSRMKRKAIDITGETTLPAFAALMSHAAMYVGLESGGFHIAWVSGIPTVGIFGGGHFDRFTPSLPHVRIVNHPMECYHCHWNCIYDEIKCITSITPEMVMAAIEDLSKTMKPTPRSGGKSHG